jgi:hypothetical protein
MRSVPALSYRRLSNPRFLILILVLTLLPTLGASGQTAAIPQSALHTGKHPVPVDQEQFLSYWTTETGWHSELQLRNNLSHQDLTVTPALRTPDGTETPLEPMTLKPNEVQSIDLETAIGSGAPQLIATYGSVVLRYRALSRGNLYALMMLRNIGHPIVFQTDATGEIPNYEAASREGIWWLPNATAGDFLILTNYGKDSIPIDLSLFDAVGKQFNQTLSLGPKQTSRFSVRALVREGHLAGSYGGIRIYAASHAGSLDSLHFLFDQSANFSALMKMFDHDPNAKLVQRDFAKTAVWTLRAPMLALAQPDPAMAFPEGTTLQPQIFVRNTTNKPLTASLRFNWRGDTNYWQSARSFPAAAPI